MVVLPAPPAPYVMRPQPPPEHVDWDAAARRYNRRVVVSLLALGLPLPDAEDVAHETWLRLIEQHEGGHLLEVKLPGLCLRQARFFGLNRLKALARSAPRSEPLDDEMPGEGELDSERALVAAQDLSRALGALNDCSPRAREVFHHVYGDPPPSHAEVAARVGLSVQRVRQILWEVRKRMRRALEEDA